MKYLIYIFACLLICCGCDNIAPQDNRPQTVSATTTEITEDSVSFSVTVTPLGATKLVGIRYGETSTLEANTVEVFSNTPRESNILTISNLTAVTTYYYQVLLKDMYNNKLPWEEIKSFTTKAKSVTETISVTSISLDTTNLILKVRETRQLTATVSPSNATNKNVRWSSNNTSVATVSTEGLVTAGNLEDTAIITAITEDGEKTATCQVTVHPNPPDNPTNVIANMDGVNIKVSWDAVPTATRYKVQICDNKDMNGCDIYYKEVTSPECSFEESALYCGINYFRVVAVNSLGVESSGASAQADRVISLTSPTLWKWDKGELSWLKSDVTGATQVYYDIYRRIGNGGWNVIEKDITRTDYIDHDYSAEEKIYYKIRAHTICEIEVYSREESNY